VRLDPERNENGQGDRLVSGTESAVAVLALATNEQAATQVRAVASFEADQLKAWLNAAKASATDHAQKAHLAYAAAQVAQFQRDAKKLNLTPASEPPDGPPIGDDEDFGGWQLN